MTRSNFVAAMLAILAATALAGDVEDGEALRAQGRFVEALASFEKAAAASPASIPLLSRAYDDLGRHAESVRAFDAALAKDPKSIVARALRARAMDARPDPESFLPNVAGGSLPAKTLLESLVAEAPKDADANWEMGRWWFRQAGAKRSDKELWAKAETCFRAAFEARPDFGKAFLHATYAQAWQGATRKVLAPAYEKAALLLPGDDGPLKKLAELNPQAIDRMQVFGRLLAKRPRDPTLATRQVEALVQEKRADDAFALLDAMEKAGPDDPWPGALRGQVLIATGKQDDGVAALVASVEKSRRVLDRRLYDILDLYAARMPQLTPEQRARIWTALSQAFPREPNALNNAGFWFLRAGKDANKAVEWYLRALDASPKDPAVMNDLGICHDEGFLDVPAKAEEWYRKAVAAAKERGLANPERCTGYKDAVDNLVKLLVRLKRAKDLLAFADESLKDDPRYKGVKALATTLAR